MVSGSGVVPVLLGEPRPMVARTVVGTIAFPGEDPTAPKLVALLVIVDQADWKATSKWPA